MSLSVYEPTVTDYEKLLVRMEPTGLKTMVNRLKEAIASSGETSVLLLHLANTYRRLGDLEQARVALKQLRTYDEFAHLNVADDAAIPFGLRINGKSAAPVVVRDGVLSEDQISSLYDEACSQADQYRKAYAGQKGSANLERRDTHVFHRFSAQRAFFQEYLTEQLPSLCRTLGVEEFDAHRIELKMSNHMDGGHFQTHADNSSVMGPSGRAISFLFYFSSFERQFDNGDLVLFDTDLENSTFNEMSFTRISPLRNRFVAFPSWYYHCAIPVNLSPNRFELGRMAVAGHVQFSERTEI